MKNKNEGRKPFPQKIEKDRTKIKQKIFWGITILLPLFLFFGLEVILRITDYGGNLDLFIDGPDGYEEYKRCNPNVARRYFSSEESVPTPPLQLFYKNKPENLKRFFVLGGSSAAGFPYSNNLSFPKILESQLQKKYPKNNIEVINIAMSAINSYSLLDLIDEVLDESPDAILIYAGHNEYYGALGVGSVQSLGNWRWLIRSYLDLHRIRIFIMIKDFIIWTKNLFVSSYSESMDLEKSKTLMARIVSEQTIELNGNIYNKGKEQFRENLDLILQKIKNNNIPVIISELVSNIKDQKPFVSIDSEDGNNADNYYKKAIEYERDGKLAKAKEYYTLAKDYDGLRFRGPEEFNSIIHSMANYYNYPTVQLKSRFEQMAKNGIAGDDLFLEHLHPNKEGYRLIAQSFYDVILSSEIIKDLAVDSKINDTIKLDGFSDLDSIYSELIITHLKNGWPFKKKGTINNFFQIYKPQNKIEDIAFKIMKKENYNLESGHLELGEYYENNGKFEKALGEYFALIKSIPHEPLFYEKAARVLISQKEFNEAGKLLEKSNSYKKTNFAYKWIGQIALRNKEYDKAILFLQKANHNDDQVLFNLSRTFYYKKDKSSGDKFLKKLSQNYPKSKYTSVLTRIRSTVN